MATEDLCVVADVTARFGNPASDATKIASLITAASREIMLHPMVQREFAPKTSSPVARTFRVESSLVHLVGPVSDLRGNPTLVRLHPESTSPQTLTLNTDYALAHRGRGLFASESTYVALRLAASASLRSTFADTFGYAQLEVTANWGVWDTADVPANVRQACVLTVGSWLDRSVDAYGSLPDDDGIVVQPNMPQTYAVPRAALQLLKRYGRTRI